VWAVHHQEQEQRVDYEEEEVSAMVIDEVAALPELAAPDSDIEADLSTPPETPEPSPELVLPQESELAEDGVVVDMLAEEEKLPADDFVVV
jgi:hypothetical protein